MDCRIVNREELSEKYLQGKLDSERQDEFEAHLIECAKCLRELELLQTVRQDLAERAHEIRGWTPRKGFFFRWKTVAVAVVVMVVIAGGIASFFQSHSVPPKINVVVLPFSNLCGVGLVVVLWVLSTRSVSALSRPPPLTRLPASLSRR